MAPAMSNGIVRYQSLQFFDHERNSVTSFRLNSSTLSFNYTEATPFTPYSLTLAAVTIRNGTPFEKEVTTLESSKCIIMLIYVTVPGRNQTIPVFKFLHLNTSI